MTPATSGERYWRDRCLQAEERLKTAREALKTFGDHLPHCFTPPCVCGFNVATHEVGEGRPETKPRRKGE